MLPSQPVLDGYYFAVVTGSAGEAVLQLAPGRNGWESGSVTVWHGGKRIHRSSLSSVHDITMGQRVGSDSPRYNFCVLHRDAAPLLLSTRTDAERRDVRRTTRTISVCSARAPGALSLSCAP